MGDPKNILRGHKGSLTRYKKAIDDFDINIVTRSNHDTYQKNIESLKIRIGDVYDQILAQCATQADVDKVEADVNPTLEEIIHLENTLAIWDDKIKEKESQALAMAELKKFEAQAKITAANPVPTPSIATVTQKPKLPTLALPRFSGSFEEWLPFRDRFSQSVDSRSDLSDAEKLQYLISSLDGQAAEAIKSLPINNASYAPAWRNLKEQYEHKRELVYRHIGSILDQPQVATPSSTSLQNLLSTTTNSLSSLESLNESVTEWDSLIVTVVTRKLDQKTRLRFHQTLPDTTMPKWSQLTTFLRKEITDLASAEPNPADFSATKPNPVKPQLNQNANKPNPFKSTCHFCKGDHFNYRCPKLRDLSPAEKKTFIDNNKACTNCLRVGHFWKNCPSSSTCRECQQKHHTSLHAAITKKPKPDRPSTTALTETNRQKNKLKPTALVKVVASNGQPIDCRVLLDNCSDESFVSSALVTRLGLKRTRLSSPHQVKALQGVGVATATEVAHVTITSRTCPEESFQIEALVVKSIGGRYPHTPLNHKEWTHIPVEGLADPKYYQAQEVSMLLATDIYHDVIRQGLLKGRKEHPTAQFSSLGWLVGGGRSEAQQSFTRCNLISCNLNSELEKFWVIEDYHITDKLMTKEEISCQQHYSANTTRLGDGSFQVRLPFKQNSTPLGNSKFMALKRFRNLETKLLRNPTLKVQYTAAMDDLIKSQHMELVPISEINIEDSQCYFLPHHAVLKEASSTTKMRVVYDGSAKTTSGPSLNDNLMVGPVLQQDLFSILTRWRWWLYALSADIKQMYLYIHIHPEDRNFLRIFWRNNPHEDIKCYRLRKVTFGTACAPYQAVRSLQQLAEDHAAEHPIAAHVLTRDFYVDDCLTGANSMEEAKQLQQQLLAIMEKGNFILRKWTSSNPELLDTLPQCLLNTSDPKTLQEDETIKALGLRWNSALDDFSFEVQPPHTSLTTKRAILAEIARVFDPLGFLSPVTIRAKQIMQQIWKSEIGWDSVPPKPIVEQWRKYQEEITAVKHIHIPRCILAPAAKIVQIHAFSDASEKAYAAAVYLRVVTASQVQVRLVASKNRVAPLKPLSLPRLELCGAHMASNLAATIATALPSPTPEICGWSDSTIVLSWIRGDPQRWKTFERNRVVQIQDKIPQDNWNHVPGEQNPADLPSRGITAQELIENKLWFEGPQFLHVHHSHPKPVASLNGIPKGDAFTPSTGAFPTPYSTTHLLTMEQPKDDKLDAVLRGYSDWFRLRRHVAYWSKLWNWFKAFDYSPRSISCSDLQRAETSIIRYIQQQQFPQELHLLRKGNNLHPRSPLLSLNPFIDQSGLIRVGGRLHQARLSYNRRHPILLPKHPVTTLIIRHHHIRMKHAGIQLTLSMIQRSYWIIRGRSVVRQVIHRCKTCVLHRAQQPQQLMADLPAPRVTPSRPFTHVGVDYAGPVVLRDSYSRSSKTHKAYICVYVCFSTKAVTLELVSSLSTEAFLASFRRFSSVRGLPACVYSDNGTNFVGAKRELQEIFAFHLKEENQQTISSVLSDSNVQWSLIPPAAPHMGGLWEAAVKSAKFHIQRIIGLTPLNFEEYATLLKEVEACLNSRPICPVSSDPESLEALTPGHFLVGAPLLAHPEPDWMEVKSNRLSRWQRTQQLKQQFWRRWHDEYLSQLQRRSKWKTIQPNLHKGDLVAIRDDHSPPQLWKLARIEDIHVNPQDDQQLVRTVTVRTSNGLIKRPITKLVLLPTNPDHEENPPVGTISQCDVAN